MTAAHAGMSMYDDMPCDLLRDESGAARLIALDHCASTMDVAHQLALDGADHGTVVVADSQGAGRGRSGNAWVSSRGAGVWASILLRTTVEAPAGVLSLRAGLALAEALDRHVDVPIQLKWPNDLYLRGRKLAGVLAEARWRGAALEWVVVGVGVNVSAPAMEVGSAALGAPTRRASALVDVVRAVLHAGRGTGELTDDELSRFASRDIAVGREIVSPVPGIVRGIVRGGGVCVQTATGDEVAVAGSLVFKNPLAE